MKMAFAETLTNKYEEDYSLLDVVYAKRVISSIK